MPEPQPFELSSWTLGALPVLRYVFNRLHIDALLERYVPIQDPRCFLAPAVTLGVALRNIVLGRRPLYGLEEWARPYDAGVLGLPDGGGDLLNDDRVGRALDQLFDVDRGSLMTAIVVRAIAEFDIDLDQLHNDSTSITFTGDYAMATGRKIRGKRAARITHGHNKDHRPDLKQLLWILTVSADGAVPIHYRVCDGNTNDDPTHIETWEALRKLAGRPDFLYVADCKLCSRENMAHIAGNKGRFVTVLPRSRKEDEWFRNHIQNHDLAWEEVIRRPNPRGRTKTEDVWRVVESPLPSAEGYRIIWVSSQRKAERDLQARTVALQKAFDAVDVLNTKLQGKGCRIRKRATVDDAVEGLLKETGTKRWVDVEVVEHKKHGFKQQGPGRPGPKTRYVRTEQVHFELLWKPKADAIAYDARSDGMWPLITNDKGLSPGQVLEAYHYQPRLEKRHEQLKTVYAVAPAFLKNEGRLEALLLLYFLALLVQALIERQVRRGMEAEGLKGLPLYPEERDCKAPTANRVLEVFENIQRHELLHDGALQQRFEPELTPLQRDLLRLLGAPPSIYPGNG